MKRKLGLQPDVPPLAPLPPRPESMSVAWRWVTFAVLALYLALSGWHAAVTPALPQNAGSLINAPDEAAHRAYVDFLVKERRLPRQGDPTYEWHQPPLYYSAAVSVAPAGVPGMRWMTIIFGIGSVALIFIAVRRLFPSDPMLAVLAMGVAALVPMRQAVYASVGNDSLLEMLCSLLFVAFIPAFTHGFTLRRAVVIGLILGAAFLTKASAILLVPIVLFALVLLWKQADESPRDVLLGAVLLFGAALTVAFPIIIRNVQLYGELTPVRPFKQEFAGTSKASDWIGCELDANLVTGVVEPSGTMSRVGYVRLVANWTFRTFFAAYTPLNRAAAGVPFFPQPPGFYLPYLVMGIAAAIGLTRLHFRRDREFTRSQLAFIWMMFAFIGLVIAAFAGFVWTYFQAQGRYLFPAMLPISVLSALGIRAAAPSPRRDAVSLAVLLVMALLSIVFLVVYVQPTYSVAPVGVGSP